MNSAESFSQSIRESFWLAALFGVAAILLYGETTLSMVSIWSRSDTFAHGFLILPISLWLIWNRRDYLSVVSSRPSYLVALLLLPVGFGWLLAWLVDVLVIQQLALVTVLIVGIWAILGHRMAWAMAFPLLFLYFAVPMGEGLIPPMMEFTATSTVWLVQQSGIPVFREGLFFTLPTGRWSVVEACSGVRYIIASVTVGALFAYLTYVTWWRRVLFLLISAIVPVFANTLRAYIIVMLGHFSDMKVATGADHLVYGWAFFGVVIFILFWLGSFFREEEQPPAAAAAGGAAGGEGATRPVLLLASLLALALASVAPVSSRWLSVSQAIDATGVTVPAGAGGWVRSETTSSTWQPVSYVGGVKRAEYVRDDTRVMLELQFSDGRSFDIGEVVGSSRAFVWPDGPWNVIRRDQLPVAIGEKQVMVDEALVRGPSGELLAWSWYRLGDLQTTNDYVAKVYEAAASFGLVPDGSLRVVIYAPQAEEGEGESVRGRLQEFLDANGAALLARGAASPMR